MTKNDALRHFGGGTALAKALTEAGYPVSKQAVSNWREVPAERQIQLQHITRGRLKVSPPPPVTG